MKKTKKKIKKIKKKIKTKNKKKMKKIKKKKKNKQKKKWCDKFASVMIIYSLKLLKLLTQSIEITKKITYLTGFSSGGPKYE